MYDEADEEAGGGTSEDDPGGGGGGRGARRVEPQRGAGESLEEESRWHGDRGREGEGEGEGEISDSRRRRDMTAICATTEKQK